MLKIILAILTILSFSFSLKSAEGEMQITVLKNFEKDCNKKNNIIWIGTTNGLYISDGFKTQKVNGIKETHIKDIFFQQDKYWITSHNGLYYILKNNLISAKSIEGLEDKIIVKFFSLPNGNLISFDHKKRIYLIDISNNSARTYEELKDFKINQIKEEQNTIWLSGLNGLYKIDKNFPEKAIMIKELKDKTIIYNENNWVITSKNGLFNLNSFEFVKGLQGKKITHFSKINEYSIIGTLGSGLYFFKENQIFPIQSTDGESISLLAQNNKYIYIALDYSGGLLVLNINNLEDNFKIDNLTGKRILEIINFENNIWLRTAHGEVFKIENNIAIKMEEQINKLKKTGQNLFLIDKDKGAYITLNGLSTKVKGLENYKINAIYFKENLYWAETYDHHIFVMKPEKPNEAIIQAKMFGANIWSINKYNNKYIIGSNKGAFSMDENYQSYLIPSTENESIISIIKVCNQLWIGTLNGYQLINLE